MFGPIRIYYNFQTRALSFYTMNGNFIQIGSHHWIL